jgi:hypothetical protein
MGCKFFNFSSNWHVSGYVISGCSLKIEGCQYHPAWLAKLGGSQQPHPVLA